MLYKEMRRAERRWRSHCVFMRRVKRDRNEHGWNWIPRPYPFLNTSLTKEGACSIWAQTTLCPCFYDPGMAGWGRFKDTPTLRHRKRECNGQDGDRINEYKAEQQLEVEKELHGTSQRREKRLRMTEKLRRVKVTCLCGYLLGHVMVRPGESMWTATSEKYGMRHPKCPNCKEKSRRLSMPA